MCHVSNIAGNVSYEIELVQRAKMNISSKYTASLFRLQHVFFFFFFCITEKLQEASTRTAYRCIDVGERGLGTQFCETKTIDPFT